MKKVFLFLCCATLLLNSCKDKKAKAPEDQTPASKYTAAPSAESATIAVDLQAVSIDPRKPVIKKGSQTTVVTNIKNNGPNDIPAGEATIHITVNGTYLNKPAGFKSDRWKLDTIYTSSGGNYEIFIRNSKPMGVNETGYPGFQFTVKGKKAGSADISLASTLSGNATTSDFDGANQSVSTVLIIK